MCNTARRSIDSHQRFCWQKDDFWRVIDRGGGVTDHEANEKAIVSLLEMNPSHLPVIENAVAQPSVVMDEANTIADPLSSSAAPSPPPAILDLVSSAFGFKLACLGKTAAELSDSSDFR
jgi:hypothetical protein